MRQIEKQRGISLIGLIIVLAFLAFIALLGMKVVPTISEYSSIKKAIETAKSGTSPAEIRKSFDKQAEVAYITAISGKDLEITKSGGETVVSFAYEKKIPLFGPASLVIDYDGTTDKGASSGSKRAGD